MTPTATTPAGRKLQGGQNGSSKSPTGHRRKLRQQSAPRAPRRVSGPMGGAAASAAPRVRAPYRRPSVASRTGRQAPIAARARAFLRSLPDHAVIDRLVRGRAWILALGVMLAGIVAMQVEVLKLGASIGRSVQRSSALAVRNEQLQASVAALADDQRIERIAAGMGMMMTPATGVGFLSGGQGANVQGVVGNIHAPNATTFLNSPSTNGIVVTPASLAAANAAATSNSSGTTVTPTGYATSTASPSTTSSAASATTVPASSSVVTPAAAQTSAVQTSTTPTGG